MTRRLLERDIEKYLVDRVKAAGGEVRKVQWIGRRSAPDRLVMLPSDLRKTGTLTWTYIPARQVWVELKNPETVETFPATPHERAQHREHERMRALGLNVRVIGTLQQVDALLS